MTHQMKGSGVALVTPFAQDGTVDHPALTRLVHHCIAGGIDFLVVLGTTGESATLTPSEKVAVLDTVKEANQGKLPIVLGIGGNNTSAVAKQIESAPDGLEGILSVSPYYNKPTQEGIYQHYRSIASATDLPIILYNVPGRTGSNVLADTTLRLAHDVANIAAVKEASGDMGQIMHIIKDAPEDFTILSGDDNLTLPMLAMGAHGVISVSGQGFPKPFSHMVKLGLDHAMTLAQSEHYALFVVTNMMFEEGNPGGIKVVLNELGICETVLRQPLWSVSDQLDQRLREATQKLMA